MNIAKEWLKAAKDDLRVIEHIIEIEDLTHMVAFHAHQAIEKSLKALIEYKGKCIPKQHDLLRLFTLCNVKLEIDEDLLDTLNELYIDARYPGDLGLLPYGKPTKEDAKAFYHLAQRLYRQISQLIGA